VPCSLAPRTRLYARHVGATRCVALLPSRTAAACDPTRRPYVHGPRRATHRVAPTLPGGEVPVPMNHAGGRAAVFAGTTHAAVRTPCRGDPPGRPYMARR